MRVGGGGDGRGGGSGSGSGSGSGALMRAVRRETEQKLLSTTATSTLRIHILTAMGRLNDNDTRNTGIAELAVIIQSLGSFTLPLFMSCLYDMKESSKSNLKPSCRQEYARLYGTVAMVHGSKLASHLVKIVHKLCGHLKDANSGVRRSAAESLGCVVKYVLSSSPATATPTSSSSVSSLAADPPSSSTSLTLCLKKLFILMAESNRHSQHGAAAGLCEVISCSTPALLELSLASLLCPQLLHFLQLPSGTPSASFQTKHTLIAALANLIAIAADSLLPWLSQFLAILLHELQSSDWVTRCAAVECLGVTVRAFASHRADVFVDVHTRVVDALTELKTDKIIRVREAVVPTLSAWQWVGQLGIAGGGGAVGEGFDLADAVVATEQSFSSSPPPTGRYHHRGLTPPASVVRDVRQLSSRIVKSPGVTNATSTSVNTSGNHKRHDFDDDGETDDHLQPESDDTDTERLRLWHSLQHQHQHDQSVSERLRSQRQSSSSRGSSMQHRTAGVAWGAPTKPSRHTMPGHHGNDIRTGSGAADQFVATVATNYSNNNIVSNDRLSIADLPEKIKPQQLQRQVRRQQRASPDHTDHELPPGPPHIRTDLVPTAPTNHQAWASTQLLSSGSSTSTSSHLPFQPATVGLHQFTFIPQFAPFPIGPFATSSAASSSTSSSSSFPFFAATTATQRLIPPPDPAATAASAAAGVSTAKAATLSAAFAIQDQDDDDDETEDDECAESATVRQFQPPKRASPQPMYQQSCPPSMFEPDIPSPGAAGTDNVFEWPSTSASFRSTGTRADLPASGRAVFLPFAVAPDEYENRDEDELARRANVDDDLVLSRPTTRNGDGEGEGGVFVTQYAPLPTSSMSSAHMLATEGVMDAPSRFLNHLDAHDSGRYSIPQSQHFAPVRPAIVPYGSSCSVSPLSLFADGSISGQSHAQSPEQQPSHSSSSFGFMKEQPPAELSPSHPPSTRATSTTRARFATPVSPVPLLPSMPTVATSKPSPPAGDVSQALVERGGDVVSAQLRLLARQQRAVITMMREMQRGTNKSVHGMESRLEMMERELLAHSQPYSHNHKKHSSANNQHQAHDHHYPYVIRDRH